MEKDSSEFADELEYVNLHKNSQSHPVPVPSYFTWKVLGTPRYSLITDALS